MTNLPTNRRRAWAVGALATLLSIAVVAAPATQAAEHHVPAATPPGATPRPAAEARHKTWISAAAGLPLPVGGLLGLRLRHPLGAAAYVQLAVGLSILGPNVALTGGEEYDSGWLWGVGLDATMHFPIFGGDVIPLPGIHGQIGHAWYLAGNRLRVAGLLSAGLPQLVGLELQVGL